jgi:hypothetical protein
MLDQRNLVRTTTFYADGFGAVPLTVLQDEGYVARDTQRQSRRSERAAIAATLVLRNRFALHTSIPNFTNVIRAHFSSNTIDGVGGAFVPSSLRYDSKWLGDISMNLRKMWCSFHQVLVTTRRSVSAFDMMVWLSTMAYAESADMEVIQVLATLYRDPEYATIHPPSALIYKLAAGDTWRRNEIQSIIERETFSFDDSSESEMPKQYLESELQHVNRIKSEFGNGKRTAIQSFMVTLQQQWPVQRPTSPTSPAISKYIHVAAAMKNITAKYEDWYNNLKFSQYLGHVSTLCVHHTVLPVDSTHYYLSMPIKRETLGFHLRKLTQEEVFDEASLCISSLGVPCEPKTPSPAQFIPANGSSNQDRLEHLCRSLQRFAASSTEHGYVRQLRVSCAALNEQVDSGLGLLDIAADFPALLQRYLCDCESFFENLNNALARFVSSSSLFSDRVGLSTDHSIRISPQFWLGQLHRDRFESLSDAWKSIIITYGVAITHLHRAARLVALSDKPVDLCEELRHVGHSNWDPLDFPETLLLEAESGIMVRQEQEFIASQMRSPKNGENAVLQLLMGGGKSSTILPILVAHFTDKKK